MCSASAFDDAVNCYAGPESCSFMHGARAECLEVLCRVAELILEVPSGILQIVPNDLLDVLHLAADLREDARRVMPTMVENRATPKLLISPPSPRVLCQQQESQGAEATYHAQASTERIGLGIFYREWIPTSSLTRIWFPETEL